MALDGEDGSATGRLAERAGRKQSPMTMTRFSLIAKGVIYPPALGRVAFTVPGTANYINRLTDQGGSRAPGSGFVQDGGSCRLIEIGAYLTIFLCHDEPV
jgi:hypothetical protein